MKNIHHMLVYVCAKIPEEQSQKEFFECGPSSGANFVMKYCQTLIGGWAMGAKVRNGV
jgi:Copper type II ascorbate-dependent monooxygenase, N-terminal domain